MERKKRKPLADITNTYNLIPLSTLRQLVASTSNPKLRSKPPVSILKSASSVTNQKLFSDSSNRSDASIESSKVSSADSRTVQFQTPPGAVASTANRGGSRNKDAANNRKRINEKDKKGETDILIVSPTPVEKRKGKGKAVSTLFSSSVPETEADVQIIGSCSIEKRKGKGKAVAAPFSSSVPETKVDVQIIGSCSTEKRKGKGKAIAEPVGSSVPKSEADGLNFGPTVEKWKDKGKAIGCSCSSAPYESEADVQNSTPTPVEITKDKGKAIDAPFSLSRHESGADVLVSSPTPAEKRKDKGKLIAIPYSSLPSQEEANILSFGQTSFEIREDKGKAIVPSSYLPYRRKADLRTSGPTPVQMRKDEGKAIALPFSSSRHETEFDVLVSAPSHLEKRKDKGKAISVSDGDILIFGPTSIERRKDKGEAIEVPFSFSSYESEADVQMSTPAPIEKREDKGKLISVPFSSSRLERKADVWVSSQSLDEKKKDNGDYVEIMEGSGKKILSSLAYKKADKVMAVLNPSISSSIEKGIASHSSCSNKRSYDEYEGVAGLSASSITKRKEKERGSIISSAERAREHEKHLNIFSSLLKKTRGRGKVILKPSNTVEIAEHEESSGSLTVSHQPLRRKRGKGNNDAGASSCPPIRRTKNLQNDPDKVGDIKSSKSWTEPRPKSRKRTAPTGELPREFVEQQKAYFKEVDEFKLEEEVVSQDDSD